MGQGQAAETEIIGEGRRDNITPLTRSTNLDSTRDAAWGKGAQRDAIRQGPPEVGQRVLTAGTLNFDTSEVYQQMLDAAGLKPEQRKGRDGQKAREGDQTEARLYSIFTDPKLQPLEKDARNAVGARIGSSADGVVRGIERSDHASVRLEGEGAAATITERDKTGKITNTWHQKEGSDPNRPTWVSDRDPKKERTDYKLEKNGNTSWEESGVRHIVRGNGTELTENPNKPNYYFDDQGRYQWIAYPDGNNLFGFSYKGNTENIAAVHTHDRSRNQSRTFVPDGTWGDPTLSKDGTYSQTTKEQHGDKTVALKHSYRANGTETHESVGENGAIVTRDEKNRIVPPAKAPADQAVAVKPKEADEDKETIGPKPTRKEQRKYNEEVKEERKHLESGILCKESEDVAMARAELQVELKKVGLKPSVTTPILDTFEHTVSVDRERDKRLDNLPEATNLAERLDLKHHNPDAVPTNERVAETYRIAAAALKQQGQGLFANDEAKAKIVIEGLRNVSDITGIDQGQRPTCGPTSGEKYIAQTRPDIYMDALKQLIGTGQYQMEHGNAFDYNSSSWTAQEDKARILRPNIKPMSEEQDWDVSREGNPNAIGNIFRRPQYGSRNWASQAIQELCLENARRGQYERKLPDSSANGTTFRHIEDFTARMTGTPMATINARDIYGRSMVSAANIRSPLTDDLAMQMQRAGRYPALDWESAHWLTVDAADQLPNSNQVVVYSDNQWGRNLDDGWTTVNNRHAKVIGQLRRMGIR
jgi:hypothetical protein